MNRTLQVHTERQPGLTTLVESMIFGLALKVSLSSEASDRVPKNPARNIFAPDLEGRTVPTLFLLHPHPLYFLFVECCVSVK